jgi:glycerol-3-phosphate dehydrogenase (NAD(P)+)
MNFCILGAGSWGTAMAVHLIQLGHGVTLAPRRMEQALSMASSRENTDYLPGVSLDQNLQIGCETRPVVMEADVLLFACPSKALRETCRQVAQYGNDAWNIRSFLALCKGLEPETFLLPHEVLSEELGEDASVGYLSGPTYARDVAIGKPAAVVIATTGDVSLQTQIQTALSSDSLRAYGSDDVRGVGLGSCLKNVYAIAVGISDGLNLGDNARAALLTRSLHEMVSLGQALGGRPETFYGLSGFGDLVATCTGDWSRNRNLGLSIGRGKQAATVISEQRSVVEGFAATDCFHSLCKAKDLEAPILSEIKAILHEGKSPPEALNSLMNRELKRESKKPFATG